MHLWCDCSSLNLLLTVNNISYYFYVVNNNNSNLLYKSKKNADLDYQTKISFTGKEQFEVYLISSYYSYKIIINISIID